MKSSFFIASSAMLALCLAGCKPDEPVKPELESLAFGKAEVELNVGDVVLLEVSATPENANYELVWSSSDEQVAVVEDGEVTALSAGKAEITAGCGDISATCTVTVTDGQGTVPGTSVENVIVEPTEAEVQIGETLELTVRVEPEDAEYESIEWASSDTGVATVDSEGVVTGVAVGTAEITAMVDGKAASSRISVTGIPVESVTLEPTELRLNEGETHTLTATVLPEDATDKGIKWSSADTDIATVDGTGLVTAVSAGETTITVTTDDGGKTATCMVTVSKGHDSVDLGLSVKWATCNIGAENPWEYGDYFAWGETEPKEEYSMANNTTFEKTISDISGNPEYDAAAANWGGTWRMPTKAEMQELIDECEWTWTELEGEAGYNITGPSGQSIFMPASGYINSKTSYDTERYGYYWTSNPDEYSTTMSSYLSFSSFGHRIDLVGRYFGLSIRPVSE